jgi:hypothetical protein
MHKLSRQDLFGLEQYAEMRAAFRDEVMKHKRDRQFSIGEHVRLCFEDRTTIQYQIQEMLRIERIFEAAAIEEELSAYNPLIPEGRNLKATMLIEYVDVEERRAALERLVRIEDTIWLAVDDDRVTAVANEDMDRSRENKTAAVHFLRFELSDEQVAAMRAGTRVSAGSDHHAYRLELGLPAAVVTAICKDFD